MISLFSDVESLSEMKKSLLYIDILGPVRPTDGIYFTCNLGYYFL